MYSLLFMKITPFCPFFKYFFLSWWCLKNYWKYFVQIETLSVPRLSPTGLQLPSMSSFMIWLWGPLWMRQLLRKMKEFSLRAGKLKADCWISGLFYWIQVWLSALSEPIFPESRHSIGILKLNCPIWMTLSLMRSIYPHIMTCLQGVISRRSVPFPLMLLGRLFFSFQAVAVPRQKPFPLLLGILLRQPRIIMTEAPLTMSWNVWKIVRMLFPLSTWRG